MWGVEVIYQRPREYDLEHENDEEDVAFYLRLTIPLARAAAATGIQIVASSAKGRCWTRRCEDAPSSTLTRAGA